jgi:hypothetical protein
LPYLPQHGVSQSRKMLKLLLSWQQKADAFWKDMRRLKIKNKEINASRQIAL